MSNGFDVRGRALQAGELAAWLSEHSLGNRFGLTVVGDQPNYGSQAVALAIVAADGDGRYLDAAALTPDDEAALASWLADPGPPKAVHDAKSAMHAVAGRGWRLRGVTSDTALAAHLLLPERRSLALNDLLMRHMRCALPAEAVAPQDYSSQTGQALLLLRTCAVLDLADVLDEELARIDSSALLARVELPVQQVLADMETRGVAVDRALLARIRDQPDEASQEAIDALLVSIAADGRIHSRFHQTSTTTGTLSSSDPDLHIARHLREAFVPGEGFAELMTAGYLQLERRITAHFGGDADLRRRVDDARVAGYAATLLGRRRYLPDLGSDNPAARDAAERAALAMAVQGSAADIVKMAMIKIDQAIGAVGLTSRMVLQTGDQLVFEVVDGERDVLAEYVSEYLGSAYSLDVPLEVSIGIGPNWGAAG